MVHRRNTKKKRKEVLSRETVACVVAAGLVIVAALLQITYKSEAVHSAEQTWQVAGVKTSSRLSQRKLDAAAKKLILEVKSGLKANGVSPEWRDRVVKKLNNLEKQGLTKKKADEIRTLIARLRVGGEEHSARASGNCNSNPNPEFTHAFTDLSVINAMNPIGGIGGGSPGRSYIGVKEGKEAPIYAPTDAVLETIIYADRGAGYGEYGLFLRASCEVEVLFDHIDKISERLMPYAPKEPVSSTVTGEKGTQPFIQVKAGELLGYTNGTDLAKTFDFLVLNYGRKNVFLNSKRWEWDQALYATCPYDYFVPELRSQYYEKIGKPSGKGFVKAPGCGNPAHDVAGTVSGGWFKGNSTDKKGEFLNIAKEYDAVHISYRIDGLAFGSREDVQKGIPYLDIMDMSPEKYPSDIRPGESVCYGNQNTWAFIQLVSETELSFATGSGPCPSNFPSKADTWVR